MDDSYTFAMNILFIIPSVKTGGGNRVFIELASRLSRDHEITMLYPNNSTDKHTFAVSGNVRFVSVGKTASGKIGKLINLWRTIRYANRRYADWTTVYSDPLFALFAGWLKAKRKWRFVQADDYRIFDDGMLLHGVFLKIYKWLCKRSFRSSRVRFIFNSRFVHERFCRDAGRTDVALRLVHPAIEQRIFTATGRSGVDTGICLIARKHPGKGLVTFLDVYRRLPEAVRDRVGPVTFVSHDDLSAFDLTGIEIVRPKNDMEIADAYRKAGIFISTSWREGFGLPPLEAMACGCACIVSESGGVDEYVGAGENCLTFPPRDEKALEDRLLVLLNDNVLRETLAKAGTATALRFSWERSAGQFLAIVRDEQC